MNEKQLIVTWAIIISICNGCASMREITYDFGNKAITQENITKIEKGKTTKSEILSMFGEPMTKMQSGALGEMWTYTRSITKEKWNWLSGWTYDPQNSQTYSITITFDENGIVKDYTSMQMRPIQTGTISVK